MGVVCGDDELPVPLQALAGRLYARLRARGCERGDAVEQAAQMAADMLGCPLPWARAAAAAVSVDRRRSL